jgi:hypothetical protein
MKKNKLALSCSIAAAFVLAAAIASSASAAATTASARLLAAIVAPVSMPERSSMILLAVGLVGVGIVAFRRK